MCPVCKRDLAPTLSICFTCGAMVNDSVREELETKIGRVSGNLERLPAVSETVAKSTKPAERLPIKTEIKASLEPAEVRATRGETSEFGRKKTSPTLVGFQPKTSSVPDWRLQLQNAIRQRKTDVVPSAPAIAKTAPSPQKRIASTPPKIERSEEPMPSHDNPRVAAALQRIENSRRRFMEDPAPAPAAEVGNRSVERSYPFNVVSRGTETASSNAPQATVNTLPRPRLVTSVKAEKRRYVTNKLPQLPEAVTAAESVRVEEPKLVEETILSVPERAGAAAEAKAEPKMLPMIDDLAEEYGLHGNDEDDDLAAIPSRFLAGLFDTIIGAFATGIVLSPFLLSGDGEWMTVSGVMTMMGGFGVVMFIYMTIAIGLRGRTIGMRLFGLEVVDAEENEYPTMHQAAVSSAVYLLSIPMLGIGFLPLLFNEERRAAHDLISGTVLVREI